MGGCGWKKWTLVTVPHSPLQGDNGQMPRETLLGSEGYVRLPDLSHAVSCLPALPWDHCPCSLLGQCSHMQG